MEKDVEKAAKDAAEKPAKDAAEKAALEAAGKHPVEDSRFFRQLWERLVGNEFTAQKLADRLRLDGGVDMEGIPHETVIDLIEGRYSGLWADVAFACSELLAGYSVTGGIEHAEQVVGWAWASFAFSDAVANDNGDWDIQFDIFMKGFCVVRAKLDTDESIHILQRVFRQKESRPSRPP